MTFGIPRFGGRRLINDPVARFSPRMDLRFQPAGLAPPLSESYPASAAG